MKRTNTPTCGATCPVQRTARVLEGKWTTLVLRDLLGGKKRYSELQRSLAGISPRLLAARLQALEHEGLVTRTVFATQPPTTEYALTAHGLQAMPVVQAMADYGQLLLAQDAARATQARAPRQNTSGAGVTRVRSGKRVADP
ncbi:MAG: winged helix-turn-helix transcriptional regulator [Rhodoferax sp.]